MIISESIYNVNKEPTEMHLISPLPVKEYLSRLSNNWYNYSNKDNIYTLRGFKLNNNSFDPLQQSRFNPN